MLKHLILLGLLLASHTMMVTEVHSAEGSLSSDVRYVESPLTWGLDVQYGHGYYRQYAFTSKDPAIPGGHAGHISFEWLPYTERGKLGLGVGLGLFSMGNVALSDGKWASLYTFPLEMFVSYRLDYIKNQIIVPFVKAGVEVTWAKQNSKTGHEIPGVLTYYGGNYSLGGELCLNKIEWSTVKQLDSNMGVNNIYITFEFLKSMPLGFGGVEALSHEEYRLGLRFEL
ncbi:MAG: hypothetical protein HY537_01215 [Deltaproteobacteria bacterium]|nr:hypothetical protein [Deltaproteobacteria bacterium]